jgi:hypothetical protein
MGNIDVQGIVVIDPTTGKQQNGLRFVGGPHEIAFVIDYSVTDTTGQLNTFSESVITSVTGQAGVAFSAEASPSQVVTNDSLADPTLTLMGYTNWFGTISASSSSSAPEYAEVFSDHPSFSAPLLPGTTTFYAQHVMNLAISNRKGVTGATATMQEWSLLFSE